MTELIRVTHQSGVVSLFLNRPERRNALSLALLSRLSDALSSEIHDDTSALIVSGGDGCFSAGADLADLTGTLEDLGMDDAIEEVTQKIRDLPVPVIAAIDGPCLGGAFDLALSCDLRIAAADAFFQVPATRLGLLYNPRSILRWRQLLGRDAVFVDIHPGPLEPLAGQNRGQRRAQLSEPDHRYPQRHSFVFLCRHPF